MAKIFIVKDHNAKTTRLVKADTRGQVSKYLASSFTIEAASPLDVADVMSSAAKPQVEDATATAAEDGETEAGASTGQGGEAPLVGEPAAGGLPSDSQAEVTA